MWRKPTDVKPSSQMPSSPAPSFSRPTDSGRLSYAPAQAAASVASPTAEPMSATLSAGASRLTSGLKIHGEISGSADLYIDGEAQGKIKVSGARVTIGPNGRVQSDIEAREIFISGSVQGNLKAVDKVQVGSTGRLQGSVLAPRLAIEDGARLHGKVDMTRQTAPRESATFESTRSSITPEIEALKPVPTGANGE